MEWDKAARANRLYIENPDVQCDIFGPVRNARFKLNLPRPGRWEDPASLEKKILYSRIVKQRVSHPHNFKVGFNFLRKINCNKKSGSNF
jgi:hypothetical protein